MGGQAKNGESCLQGNRQIGVPKSRGIQMKKRGPRVSQTMKFYSEEPDNSKAPIPATDRDRSNQQKDYPKGQPTSLILIQKSCRNEAPQHGPGPRL